MKNTTTSEVIKKIYSKKKIKRFIELCLGALLVALSFNIFCLPNNLVSGGISGLSIITESLFNLTPSVVILVIDMLLVVLSYFLLGKEKTFYSYEKSPYFLKTYFCTHKRELGVCVKTPNSLFSSIYILF